MSELARLAFSGGKLHHCGRVTCCSPAALPIKKHVVGTAALSERIRLRALSGIWDCGPVGGSCPGAVPAAQREVHRSGGGIRPFGQGDLHLARAGRVNAQFDGAAPMPIITRFRLAVPAGSAGVLEKVG